MLGARLSYVALGLALLLAWSSPAYAAAGYMEGQVWAYRTRPVDIGSLLKIQKIEHNAKGRPTVYHLTIIGVHLSGADAPRGITHVPVTRFALDSSVTQLAQSDVGFPSADEGIAEWRRAEGGVFAKPVSEIVEIISTEMAKSPPTPASP